MKILFIDLLSYHGHVKFNRIQLNALRNIGITDIDIICTDFMAEELNDLSMNVIYTFSEKWYPQSTILSCITLPILEWFIFFKSKKQNYDYIIFSTYDSLTFWLSPFRKGNVLLFNHINVPELNNRIKRMCVKRISKRVKHIVFNDYMKEGMNKWGITNVIVIPHGFITSPNMKSESANGCYIFCPSENSADIDFIMEMKNSDELLSFLKTNNIKLIIKAKNIISKNNEDIIIIDKYQPTEEYIKLFQNAWLILLAYSKRIDYRCSGVLNECFSMSVPSIINDCDNFRVYQNYFNYDPFFDKNVNSLIDKLNMFINSPIRKPYYINIEEQKSEIGWRRLLETK